jgi:hypothetical protein
VDCLGEVNCGPLGFGSIVLSIYGQIFLVLYIYYWQIKWLKMGCVIWQVEAQTGFASGFGAVRLEL